MRVFAFFLFSFYFQQLGAQQLCLDLFTQKDSTQILSLEEKVGDLFFSTTFANNNETQLDLYFSLLDLQTELNHPDVVFSDLFHQQVFSHFAKQYAVPAKPRDFVVFVQNRLHFLASQAAWNWKKQTLENWAQKPLKGATLTAAQSLFDSFFSLGAMNEIDVSPRYVREVLASDALNLYPWPEAITIYEAWFSHNLEQRQHSQFYAWYEKQKDLPVLSFPDLQRLHHAMTSTHKQPSVVFCCKSQFACKQCPHNRYWLHRVDIFRK